MKRVHGIAALRTRLFLAVGAMTVVSMHCEDPEPVLDPPETACIPLDAAGECPMDADAPKQIADLNPNRCFPSLAEPGATLVDGACCYQVRFDCSAQVVGCSISGRPLLIEGRPLKGAVRHVLGWQETRLTSPKLDTLDAESRSRLAMHWARIGAAEHASVAGFQRFGMDLLANGAPPEWMLAAQKAAQDEIRHARLAFTLASAFAGTPIGPAALDLPAAIPIHRSLEALAIATAVEGCTVETFSACLLAESLEHATDAAVREVLTKLRRDEDRHAELSWQVLAWALSQEPSLVDAVEAALSGAIAALRVDDFASGQGLPAFGLLTHAQAKRCLEDAIRLVIVPCKNAILRR